MLKQKKIVSLTPLRSGSKTIVSKNLQMLGGKPLLAWPLQVARATPEIDRVLVSTDCDILAARSREYGAEIYKRPLALAQDDSLVIDVIKHLRTVLQQEGPLPDIMVLLEATSPFRTPELISRCLHRMITENLDSIATFNESPVSPMRAWEINHGVPEPYIKSAIPWLPRQHFKKSYHLNGAVYAFNLSKLPEDSLGLLFGKMGAEVIPARDSIDIDDKQDLMVANAILESGEVSYVI